MANTAIAEPTDAHGAAESSLHCVQVARRGPVILTVIGTWDCCCVNTMSSEFATHYGLSRLLRETLPQPTVTEATCLVGIIFQSNILFMGATWMLPALEPPEATGLVAELYGLDATRLLERFQDNWCRLKNTAQTASILEKLEANDFVDRIVPYDWDRLD